MLDLSTVDTLSQILCWGRGTSWVLQAVEQHPSFPTANTLPPPLGKPKIPPDVTECLWGGSGPRLRNPAAE